MTAMYVYRVSLVGVGLVCVTLWLGSDSFDQAARVARRLIGQEFRVVSTRTVWCSKPGRRWSEVC